eukprot:26766_1
MFDGPYFGPTRMGDDGNLHRCESHVMSRLSDDDAPIAVTRLSKSDISILGGYLSLSLFGILRESNQYAFLQLLVWIFKSLHGMGRTQDVAGLASTQFPQPLAEQIIRHMNAAHIAAYIGLGGPYSRRHFFIITTTSTN